MELNQPPPSSQDPDSALSRAPPPAQPIAEPTPPTPPSAENLYRRLSSYPFHSDQEYQLGLATILGHPSTPPTASEIASNQDLVLQAQCFYLARKFNLGTIDVEAYKEWLAISQRAKEATEKGIETGAHGNGIPSPAERPSAPTPSTASSTLPIQPSTEQNRPSAPTPSTAAASTLPVQPHTQTSSQSAQNPEPAPPYPTSFADIVDLITQNKPIPGIEEIPDTVLEPGSSKVDRAVRRKKPWEKDQDVNAAVTGTAAGDEKPKDENSGEKESEKIDIEQRKQTGEGVMKILQPGAVPDSGLIASD